jgi:hypothetical protein
MKQSTFHKLAATVAANAHTYRSKVVCVLMGCRLTAAYRASGSYGCDHALMEEARWAIRDRWAKLNALEIDARWNNLFARGEPCDDRENHHQSTTEPASDPLS